MSPSARVLGLECLRCHTVFEEPGGFSGCPRCRQGGVAVNLTVRLDLSPLAGLRPEGLPTTPRGLWRYHAVLPVAAEHAVSLGGGATPLVPLERLGKRPGLPRPVAKGGSPDPPGADEGRRSSGAARAP